MAPLYRRSPFQIALLFFLTFGLYMFYWAFKVRRWCEVTLERPNQSWWKTIALIVPIFNLFLLFDLGSMIKGVAFRAGTPVPNTLPFNGVIAFFLQMLYRLPEPYWIVCSLSFLPITAMHFAFERAQLAIHDSAAAPTGFMWFEWVLVALGIVQWILILIGATFINLPKGSIFPIFFIAGAFIGFVVILGFVKVRSGRFVRSLVY